MTLRQLLAIALRYTLNRQGAYLSGYLSSLSVVGIALAICLLLIVLSVMNGFEREMRDNILALVPQLTLKSLQPVTGWREGQERIASFPGVRGVAPYVQTEAMLAHGGRIDTAIVNGISLPDEARAGGLYQRLEASALERFAADSHGVLLGAKLAEKLQVTAGGPVTLITPSRRGRAAEFAYLRVSGLLDTGTEWDHSAALLHLDMASRLAGLENAVHGYRITLDDLFQAGPIGWQLVRGLPAGYYASDWTMTHGNLYAAIRMSRDLIGMLLLSIIAIAAFNVVSSLVLVVVDKQGDIAILRALGATQGNIRVVFLLQGLLIAAIGVFLGSLLGILGSYWASDLAAGIEALFNVQFLSSDIYPVDYLPADLRWADVAAVGITTTLMCFLAALYPAHRAAKFLPAEVLRHE